MRQSDLQFITVLAPRIEEQAVRVLDVAVSEDTPVWRRGLNKSPSELETKMVTSLQRELDKSGLYLEKLPDGGVALHTESARREGDEICLVTGLLYDSVASMTTFLSHGGNRVLVDRLVEIRGLGLADDAEGSLYMAITGVARYLRHYLGVRRGGPNAVFMVQTGNGCGDGLVKCVVQTRNGVGIAAKSPVVINYGNEYDINVATMAAASDEGDAKRFRGVLDEYFKKQSAFSAPAAANSETAGAASEASEAKAVAKALEPATPPKVVPKVDPKVDPSTPTGSEATKRPPPQPTGTPPTSCEGRRVRARHHHRPHPGIADNVGKSAYRQAARLSGGQQEDRAEDCHGEVQGRQGAEDLKRRAAMVIQEWLHARREPFRASREDGGILRLGCLQDSG